MVANARARQAYKAQPSITIVQQDNSLSPNKYVDCKEVPNQLVKSDYRSALP